MSMNGEFALRGGGLFWAARGVRIEAPSRRRGGRRSRGSGARASFEFGVETEAEAGLDVEAGIEGRSWAATPRVAGRR